jgi:cytochrome c peroxidase
MKKSFMKSLASCLSVGICLVGLSLSAHAGLYGIADNRVPDNGVALLQKIELGKKIFFDASLSTPRGQSCASCHDPATGIADPDTDLPVSEGVIQGRFGNRNAQSISYSMFTPPLYFDSGRSIQGRSVLGRANEYSGRTGQTAIR